VLFTPCPSVKRLNPSRSTNHSLFISTDELFGLVHPYRAVSVRFPEASKTAVASGVKLEGIDDAQKDQLAGFDGRVHFSSRIFCDT
jgi:hypothetical protein